MYIRYQKSIFGAHVRQFLWLTLPFFCQRTILHWLVYEFSSYKNVSQTLSSYSYLHTCINKSQTKHYFDILCFVNLWNFPFFISSRVKYVDFFVHNKCIQFTFKNSKKKDLFHWWWQEKNDIIVTDLFNTYNLYHHFCVYSLLMWAITKYVSHRKKENMHIINSFRGCTNLFSSLILFLSAMLIFWWRAVGNTCDPIFRDVFSLICENVSSHLITCSSSFSYTSWLSHHHHLFCNKSIYYILLSFKCLA